MATRRRHLMETVTRDAVTAYCHFQFSGSGGVSSSMPNFTGSGFNGCYISGTTYTLKSNDAWPQLAYLQAQIVAEPSYVGTASGTLDVVFNGSQLKQFTTLYTGSQPSPTGSGTSQSIDFRVVQGTNGLAVAVPYFSGNNWCYVQAVFLTKDYSRG
jgi:hypothetical protein